MKEFPKTTLVNKVFSESKFFKKLALSKKTLSFGNIEKIIWRNKLSPHTLNVKAGVNVQEIQVFEVRLKSEKVGEQILRTIDNNIPYHILFLVEFSGKYQAWMGYKETNASGVAFTVKNYYKTDWQGFESIPLSLSGLTLDEVYSELLAQLNANLQNSEKPELRARVNDSLEIEKLEREINQTSSRLFKEKQFNKQQKLNARLKGLKEKLKTLR